MRIVLDTNVLVSALLTGDGHSARIFRSVCEGSLTLVLSEPLLAELHDVLCYPKIKRRLEARSIDVVRYVELLRFIAMFVGTNVATVPAVRDPDDRELLAALLQRPADWLITGDQDLLALSADHPMLGPAEFVERFLA